MTLDPGAFRFEAVYEAIAPDGSRTRIGSYAIPSVCLTCGGPIIHDDYATGTASVDGTTMVTVGNQPGMLCVGCTRRHRRS